jgi:hypothetical protein
MNWKTFIQFDTCIIYVNPNSLTDISLSIRRSGVQSVYSADVHSSSSHNTYEIMPNSWTCLNMLLLNFTEREDTMKTVPAKDSDPAHISLEVTALVIQEDAGQRNSNSVTRSLAILILVVCLSPWNITNLKCNLLPCWYHKLFLQRTIQNNSDLLIQSYSLSQLVTYCRYDIKAI